MLNENSSICTKALVSIINKGILDGKFDDGLKLANLISSHKEDKTTNKKNYRNISLLPVVSKKNEKIIQKQIRTYIETYLSILWGYRKGYNVQYDLLSMLEKWKATLDKRGFGGAVLMDLSNAFDTIKYAYGFEIQA